MNKKKWVAGFSVIPAIIAFGFICNTTLNREHRDFFPKFVNDKWPGVDR